jgi:hypothetical protein
MNIFVIVHRTFENRRFRKTLKGIAVFKLLKQEWNFMLILLLNIN